jgi:hypothetical protein
LARLRHWRAHFSAPTHTGKKAAKSREKPENSENGFY